MTNSLSGLWENALEFGEENDSFTGQLIYKRTRKSKTNEKSPFRLALGHKRLRMEFETNKQEFYSQGKKLVAQLEQIDKSLNELNKR